LEANDIQQNSESQPIRNLRSVCEEKIVKRC
jgi:hypothetical protein